MRKRLAAIAAIAAVLMAGCGGDDDSGSQDAKKAPATGEGAKGSVSWCIGKDTSGAYARAIELFAKENSKVKVELLELPESADEQRTQLIQRLRAESDECDVLGLDVIWTAEFAAQEWLQDVGSLIEQRKGDFIASTLETATYQDKYWAVPYHTNAGFLYSRTDVAKETPATWQDVYSDAQSADGIVYQGFRYEGLTVNFLELLYSAGGEVLSEDGETVEVDSPETREVLEFMAGGIEDGAAPKAVLTYKEEEARRAFESGDASFMRNWPYAYSLAKESKIADEFEASAFPSFGEGEPASVLGGINLAISAYSKNPEAAAAFIDFAAGEANQKEDFLLSSNPPTLTSVYEDPEVTKKYAFAADLLKAIEQGRSRPVTPVYSQVSQAIYDNVYAALQGKVSADEAVTTMKSDIEKALETF